MQTFRILTAAGLLAAALTITPVSAQSINLSSWTVEADPGISVAETASWLISADRLSATQLNNPVPTVFYSDFDVDRALVRAELRVDPLASPLANDDDWIGFAIGFDPGETQNPGANFIYLDWKMQDQLIGDLQTVRGLAVSRAFGIPTNPELRGHFDDPANPDGGVVELARGATLGNVGWEFDRTYVFEFEILPGSLRVFVDGQLEIDLPGLVVDRGRFACYNDSQGGMSCGNISVEELVPPRLSLDTWNDESYRFSAEAPGSWLLAADALSAEQVNRNDASIFYSDFQLSSDVVIAELVTVDNSDDDYMGFVLGFDPGETLDPGAEYLVIDWKKTTQSGQVDGEPFTANAGLAVSRVTGLPSLAELFGHNQLGPSTAGGVVELARGANLGAVGWEVGARYVFTFEVTPVSLKVWVEDLTREDGPRLEIDLTGDFSATAGRFGCFSNSQPRVECGNILRSPLD